MNARDFELRSTVQTLSLEDVFMGFEGEFGKTLTWDDIMDQIMLLKRSATEESAESPRSIDVNELVYISRRSNSSAELPVEEYQRSPRVKSDLRIPQTPPSNSQEFPVQVFEPVISASLPPLNSSRSNYLLGRRQQPGEDEALDLSYPESTSEADLLTAIDQYASRKQITCLSAAGFRLSEIPTLPFALIVLNLADNSISDIGPLSSLSQVQFLNLSYNNIYNLSGLQNMTKLSELYLAQNSLTRVSSLQRNTQLNVLDLSHNNIEFYEELASLVSNKMLRVLRVKGNKIKEKKDFESNLRALLPFVENLDPPSVTAHSAFSSYGELAFSSFSLKNSFSQSLSLNSQEPYSPLQRSYTESSSLRLSSLDSRVQAKINRLSNKTARVPRLSLKVGLRKGKLPASIKPFSDKR
mmetsp:Transcript_8095/g.15920  ORF Transcript_8095/g.15920 Transcript_8095/m.15920 type:complete len:411 (-) Transcript_8095:930-2162(-)